MRLYPADNFPLGKYLRGMVKRKILTAYILRSKYYVLVDDNFRKTMNYLGLEMKGWVVRERATKITHIPYERKDNNRKGKSKRNI